MSLLIPLLQVPGQTTLAIVAGFFLTFLWYTLRWFRLRRSMPPGPLGFPFIGNSHQIPEIKPWRKFTSLNEQYGPVISLMMGDTPVIVLGTAKAAWELLDKRSDIYSSRPRFIIGGEILSDNKRGLMLPYGEAWRKWRKILHSAFHARRADTYRGIQSDESKIMMHQMLHDPEHFERHLQRYAASVVTSVAYDRRVDSVDEWIVQENMQAMDYLTSVNIPGKYIVESMPWLLRLPKSLQWFRKEPEAQRQRDVAFLMHLYKDVESRMKDGAISDCMTSQTIANREKNGWSELDVAYAVSTPFGAGIETTAGTLSIFFLAMLHFPEAMRKAQEELDKVVGPDQMPEFQDKDRLPYISAVINETLRWRPVAVLGGSPHAVMTDDEYQGMYIPKGSTIFANLDGIMQDPEMFPSPEMFLPERFVDATDPRLQTFDLPFGFGRRICPGAHLALNSLFINVARILWAFDILPEYVNGEPILPDTRNFTNGFNSRPVSFRCRVVPRNDKVEKCILAESEAAKARLLVTK
ncbi:hypothetical protein HGRIS_012347 [Hohenbuehelia grisea]|uniref:Cytochrome P450 n=1 Tax=Hohenbuehelia grisea TaxID=104357 RepID=A0ABR3IS26_9AGAR